MIKKLIKIILIITSTLIFLIVYLSFVGIETEKFNERNPTIVVALVRKTGFRFTLNPSIIASRLVMLSRNALNTDFNM